MKLPQQAHIFALDKQELLSAPEPCQMNVMDAANLVYEELHAGLVIRVSRPLFLLIDDKDVTWIRFSHYLDRVSCDDALSEPCSGQPEELALQIRMHIN